MAHKYFKERAHKPSVINSLKRYLPTSGKIEFKKQKVSWKGWIKPHPFCKSYKIEITYNGISPRIYLYLSLGDIERIENRKIPHHYIRDSDYSRGVISLCLYYPKSNEFNKNDRFERTIIPWTYEWLYYFEVWLVTDEWKGGGIEHSREGVK